jgi:hypothetical protein
MGTIPTPTGLCTPPPISVYLKLQRGFARPLWVVGAQQGGRGGCRKSPVVVGAVEPTSDAGRGTAGYLASFAIDYERVADTDLNPIVVGVRDATMRLSEG